MTTELSDRIQNVWAKILELEEQQEKSNHNCLYIEVLQDRMNEYRDKIDSVQQDVKIFASATVPLCEDIMTIQKQIDYLTHGLIFISSVYAGILVGQIIIKYYNRKNNNFDKN